jgi:hypothetical protein
MYFSLTSVKMSQKLSLVLFKTSVTLYSGAYFIYQDSKRQPCQFISSITTILKWIMHISTNISHYHVTNFLFLQNEKSMYSNASHNMMKNKDNPIFTTYEILILRQARQTLVPISTCAILFVKVLVLYF